MRYNICSDKHCLNSGHVETAISMCDTVSFLTITVLKSVTNISKILNRHL
jgi:hypothetical protein